MFVRSSSEPPVSAERKQITVFTSIGMLLRHDNGRYKTLKGIFRRAFLVCSTDQALRQEIQYLKTVFTKTNGYPSKIVHNTLEDVRRKWIETAQPAQSITPQDNQVPEMEEPESTPYICLPYKGVEGEKVVHDFKRNLRSVLPRNIKPRFIYKGIKL